MLGKESIMECPKCGLDVLAEDSEHLDPETLTPCPAGVPKPEKAEAKAEPKKASK